MKLGRRQKRILKRKLKRIAGDVVAVIVGAGMFVGLFVAWANEPMPDCRNPAATKQQEAGWNRMVRDLEHRKAKENHRKEVKTNGRNA